MQTAIAGDFGTCPETDSLRCAGRTGGGSDSVLTENAAQENSADRQSILLREAQLVAEAERAGVRVYSTSGYYLEGNARHATILLGFVRMSVEEIREAVELLAEAWGINA